MMGLVDRVDIVIVGAGVVGLAVAVLAFAGSLDPVRFDLADDRLAVVMPMRL